MMVRPAEEENEAEVRRVDQDNINKFARLNARLHDLRDERAVVKVRIYFSLEKEKELNSLVSFVFLTLFSLFSSSPIYSTLYSLSFKKRNLWSD